MRTLEEQVTRTLEEHGSLAKLYRKNKKEDIPQNTGKASKERKEKKKSPKKRKERPEQGLKRSKREQSDDIKIPVQEEQGNPPVDQQSQLSERFRLEQSIAGLVGGKTGLMMFLDVLIYDVEEKRYNAFRSHAQDYIQKANALEKVIEQYEKLVPQDPSLKLYQNLLAIGKDLKEITGPRFNGTLTDEQLDCWRKDTLQRIMLYKEKGGDV